MRHVRPRFIRTVTTSTDTLRGALGSVRTVLFDGDGVLWRGDTEIPGAMDTIEALRQAGKRVMVVTNNSAFSRDQYVNKCLGFGLEIEECDIVSTAYCTALWLSQNMDPTDKIFVIGGDGLAGEIEAVGIEVIRGSKFFGLECANKNVCLGDTIDPGVGAVVIGLDLRMSYRAMAYGVGCLQNGARFIATNTDSTFPVEGRLLPGSGMGVAALSTSAGRSPDIIIGKPHSTMADIIVKANPDIDTSTMLMVGDRLETDILFGKNAGMPTMLVMGGVTQPEDIADGIVSPEHFPDFVGADVNDIRRALD